MKNLSLRQSKQPFYVARPDNVHVLVPPLSERLSDLPWPMLPERMFVVIDGWDDTQKGLVAYWLAYFLGALFVDCRFLPLAIAKDFASSGGDIKRRGDLLDWSKQLRVEVSFSDETSVLQGLFTINGQSVRKDELASYADLAAELLKTKEVFDCLSDLLSEWEFDDRVVLLGSDLVTQLPEAPYKFFFDEPGVDREYPEKEWGAYWWAGDAGAFNGTPTYFSSPLNVLVLDCTQVTVGDAVMIALVESVARANDLRLLRASFEDVLTEVRQIADNVRQFIDSAYGGPEGEALI